MGRSTLLNQRQRRFYLRAWCCIAIFLGCAFQLEAGDPQREPLIGYVLSDSSATSTNPASNGTVLIIATNGVTRSNPFTNNDARRIFHGERVKVASGSVAVIVLPDLKRTTLVGETEWASTHEPSKGSRVWDLVSSLWRSRAKFQAAGSKSIGKANKAFRIIAANVDTGSVDDAPMLLVWWTAPAGYTEEFEAVFSNSNDPYAKTIDVPLSAPGDKWLYAGSVLREGRKLFMKRFGLPPEVRAQDNHWMKLRHFDGKRYTTTESVKIDFAPVQETIAQDKPGDRTVRFFDATILEARGQRAQALKGYLEVVNGTEPNDEIATALGNLFDEAGASDLAAWHAKKLMPKHIE